MLKKYIGTVVKNIKGYKGKYSSGVDAIVIEFENGEILEITYGHEHADDVWLEYGDKLTNDYSDSTRYIHMNSNSHLSNEELLDKLKGLTENKDSAPNSQAYDEYCDELTEVNREILSRMTK